MRSMRVVLGVILAIAVGAVLLMVEPWKRTPNPSVTDVDTNTKKLIETVTALSETVQDQAEQIKKLDGQLKAEVEKQSKESGALKLKLQNELREAITPLQEFSKNEPGLRDEG